jgi:hypothetical protein
MIGLDLCTLLWISAVHKGRTLIHPPLKPEPRIIPVLRLIKFSLQIFKNMRAFRSLDELYQYQDSAWRGVHQGEGTVKIIDGGISFY